MFYEGLNVRHLPQIYRALPHQLKHLNLHRPRKPDHQHHVLARKFEKLHSQILHELMGRSPLKPRDYLDTDRSSL